jgi:hypothetical protein
MIDENKIAKLVAEEICDKHGFAAQQTAHPSDVVRRGNNLYFELDIAQDLGIFKMIVDKARLKVQVSQNTEDTAERPLYWVQVSLIYEHSLAKGGGRNGYTIGNLWINGAYQMVESTI